METVGLLPHSQVPATCPYPQPARSSPYPHIPLPENRSYYYPPIYAWVSQVVSFPQVSPPKTIVSLSTINPTRTDLGSNQGLATIGRQLNCTACSNIPFGQTLSRKMRNALFIQGPIP